MLMKLNLIALLIIVTLVACMATTANAYSTGFEDIVYGSYSTIDYSWVSFSNNMGNLNVVDSIPGPPLSGIHSVIGPNTWNSQERNIANFLVSGIRQVSVVMGDYDADQDPLYLEAYNSSNVLVGSDYQVLASHIYGGLTLSVATAQDISYVHFYSGQPYPGSVFFDNFSAVPEPATMVMLGIGGLAAIRRRKK